MKWRGVKLLVAILVAVATLSSAAAADGVGQGTPGVGVAHASNLAHRQLKAKDDAKDDVKDTGKVDAKGDTKDGAKGDAKGDTKDGAKDTSKPQPEIPVVEPRPAFMLFGDSITQFGMDVDSKGWGTRLQQAFVRSVDVINRGLASYNTTNFINFVLPTVANEVSVQFKPVFMTLWLGTNDAAIVDGPCDSQHVPVKQYVNNLVLILTKFHKWAPHAKILVITPGVVDDAARRNAFWGGRPDRSNAQSKIYAAACVEATKDLPGVTVLDLHSYLMSKFPNDADRADLLGDGLHLSMAGNNVVYDLVSKQIRQLLPSTLLQTPQFPYF